MTVTLLHGDCVTWAREYSGEPFHALLCDAPYEMNFMSKGWDASGVAFDPETWRALASVLYPGAFMMVFAGTINDDLISMAMREAGLRKFHKMQGWLYGSGFPKATRLNHGHPMTDAFKGHRYGLQALKPALETVLIFQKPYAGRPVDSITATGAGALNVDGGRITPTEDYGRGSDQSGSRKSYDGGIGGAEYRTQQHEAGRWPANFFLSEAAAPLLDEQSGERVSGGGNKRSSDAGMWNGKKPQDWICESSTGGASRFFFRVSEQIDAADPVRYVAKASRRERDAGLEGMPTKRVPRGSSNNLKQWENGERTFEELDEKSKAFATEARNVHPTVKPLSLTRYLATLLLPPAEYAPRRIFCPFAGVASECIGAMQAGWEEVTGVEITPEYLPIARARVEYWQGQVKQMSLVEAT